MESQEPLEPPPNSEIYPGRQAPPKLQIAADFNAGHKEDCECCVPTKSSLKPGFWKKVGLSEQADSEEGESTRAALLLEVEKEIQLMNPIERTGSVFGWRRAGEMAFEDGDMDGAGDCYARALAFGAALGDDATPFPAWYPRHEVDKLCSEVLVKVAELEILLADAEGQEDWLRKAQTSISRALQLDPSNLAADALRLRTESLIA